MSLVRGDEPNQEYLDLYTLNTQNGLRIAKAGSGTFKDFVISQYDRGLLNDVHTFLNASASGNLVLQYPAGNVGIGVTNPQSALEIAGGIKLNGEGHGITFPDGTTQTTACGSLAFGAPGQVQAAGTGGPGAAPVNLPALLARLDQQDKLIEALRAPKQTRRHIR